MGFKLFSQKPCNERIKRGRYAERLAVQFLESQGYLIERTNVRFPIGEIDIIAREGAVVCFIEVRSTSSAQWGGPLSSISFRKQRHIIQAARWYLKECQTIPAEVRFDVVAIDWNNGCDPAIELIRGAFDAGRASIF